jgi:hypothetical protein
MQVVPDPDDPARAGAKRASFPATSALIHVAAGLERYELGAPGLVSDGYHHALLVDRKQSLAYIVQVGGIAGTRTTYGPLRLHAGCGKSAKA